MFIIEWFVKIWRMENFKLIEFSLIFRKLWEPPKGVTFIRVFKEHSSLSFYMCLWIYFFIYSSVNFIFVCMTIKVFAIIFFWQLLFSIWHDFVIFLEFCIWWENMCVFTSVYEFFFLILCYDITDVFIQQ